jgi:Txe/YoeB family toxin of Txe-Axe toxin-antitoxin module
MEIKEIRDDLEKYLKKHNLNKKYVKAKNLFEEDPFYPSLNTELLEPKDRLIYSFRLDRKYRAIFIYLDNDTIEIIIFTNHYK